MENQEETKVVEEVTEAKTTETASQEQVKKPGLYIAGLVCSIVGLCFFWSVWIGLICGVLGIVFGAVTLSKTNKKIPIILGGVATGLAIIMLIVYSVIGGRLFNRAASKLENNFNDVFDNIENAVDEYEDGDNTTKNIIEDTKEKADERQKQYEKESEETKKNIDEASKEINDKINEAEDSIQKNMDETTKKVEDLFNNITN